MVTLGPRAQATLVWDENCAMIGNLLQTRGENWEHNKLGTWWEYEGTIQNTLGNMEIQKNYILNFFYVQG